MYSCDKASIQSIHEVSHSDKSVQTEAPCSAETSDWVQSVFEYDRPSICVTSTGVDEHDVVQLQKDDAFCKELIDVLETQTYPADEKRARDLSFFSNQFSMKDGVLIKPYNERLEFNNTECESDDEAATPYSHNKTPAQGTSANKTPAQGTAANKTPAQGTSANKIPAQGTAANTTPTQGTSANKTPAQGTSANKTPAQGNSAYKTPAQGTAANKTPAQGTAANKIPAQGTSANETQSQKPTSNTNDNAQYSQRIIDNQSVQSQQNTQSKYKRNKIQHDQAIDPNTIEAVVSARYTNGQWYQVNLKSGERVWLRPHYIPKQLINRYKRRYTNQGNARKRKPKFFTSQND
ncbi:hypothetical protein ACF0H5_006438 [Mactra antiquata]